MKLSELRSVFPSLVIKNDAFFDALGMATSTFTDKHVLSFLENPKFKDAIVSNNNITAVITTKEIAELGILPDSLGIVISTHPKQSFYEIHNKLVDINFYWQAFENEIADSAKVSEKAILADHSIKIGENSIIEPGVIIESGAIIGDNVIIRSGTVVGTAGFQFLNNESEIISVKTGGRVVIHNQVEVQHNCTIDRGVFGGNTVLLNDVKVDNLVHIAHDSKIGERTLITAGSMISGRVTIGKDCWIGVNSTISNGINIGDNCKITLGSVVTQDVQSNTTVTGNFAIDHKKFIEFIKTIR